MPNGYQNPFPQNLENIQNIEPNKTSLINRIKNIKNNPKLLLLLLGISFIFVLLIGIFIFALTRPKTVLVKTEPQPISLKMWSFTENSDHMKKLLDNYHSANPLITVNFEQRNISDYKDILEKRLKEDPTTLPDILELDSKDVKLYSQGLSPADDNVISLSDYQQMFFSQVQKDNILNGSIYGVPASTDGLILVYNSDIVKPEEIPTYWPAFVKYALSKTKVNPQDSNKNDQNGIALSNSTKTNYLAEIIQLLIMQNKQKNFYDDTGQINLDESDTIQILNFFEDFVSKHPWDESSQSSIEAFSKGNTAMAFVKAKDLYDIKTLNPNLKFSTHVMPIISDQLYWSSYTSYSVSSSSQNSIEAWKFLKYLKTEDSEKYLYQTANLNKLPKKPYTLKTLAEELKADPLLSPVGIMAPNMTNWATPDKNQVNKIFEDFIKFGSSFTEGQIKDLNKQLNDVVPTYP